jgi:uncharacterized protein (TIGR02246 family)
MTTRILKSRAAGLVGLIGLIVLAAGAALAAAPLPVSAPAKAPTDREKIAAIEERIQAAFAAGDAEAVAAEYTEDGMLLAPSNPSIVGRAQIADLYRAIFKDYKCTLKTEVQEAEVNGDWAFVRGVLTSTIAAKAGGEPHVSHGKYIAVVRRGADGVWRFSHDIYNTDQPPGGH